MQTIKCANRYFQENREVVTSTGVSVGEGATFDEKHTAILIGCAVTIRARVEAVVGVTIIRIFSFEQVVKGSEGVQES